MTLPILSALAAAATLYILLPSLAKLVLRNHFLRLCVGAEEACLTFDDGPDPLVTPKLLELLDDAGVKATFFVVGKKARACPQLVATMIDMGHEIGEHTHEHYFPWTSGPMRSAKDLWGCAQVLDTFNIAKKGRLFRPPFGKLNLVTLIYILMLRRRVAFWSVDPQDYNQKSGAEVAAAVAKDLAPGAVVLLHDGTTNIAQESGNPVVVDAVKGILDHARKTGITLTTLSSMLPKKIVQTNSQEANS